MVRALLDVNVLVALLDEDHIDHRRVRQWFGGELDHGWSSCAITQNGAVRVMSQPAYPKACTPAEAVAALAGATATAHHEFWTCEVSLLDARAIAHRHLLGHRQVTDVYLLALAVAAGGRFVTLDRSVPLSAVGGATSDHLVVV